jgi:Rrf2 family protein
MTQITAGVEYALHCLHFLVQTRDKVQSASVRDLAELQGVPAEYVAKVFTKLQKAGLVAATEGVRGGFRLARKPEKISVLDVIVAIDGEKPLFECREIRGRCALFRGKPAAWAIRGVCAIHAIMLEAEARMREVLRSYSLADIAAQVTSMAPASYAREIAAWLTERAPEARRSHGENSPH